MNSKLPVYIKILYFAICIFLLTLIVRWFLSAGTTREGATSKTPYMTNPQYSYIPSEGDSNLRIKFGLGDLDVELENAVAFLKLDNSIVYTDPSAVVQPSEYSVPQANLKIDTLYNNSINATQYSSTSGITSTMDASYGQFFDSNTIQDWTNEKIQTKWNEMNSVQIDDAIYNTAKYFVIQSEEKDRLCLNMATDTSGASFGGYFLQGIIANKFNPSGLLKLKNAYYSVIKPRFLANKASNVYWQNWQTLTNADGKSHDSVVYVINIINGLVTTPTLPEDLSGANTQTIVSSAELKTPFTMDSLRIYQTVSIAYELCRFLGQFSAVLKPEQNPIKTTASVFVVGFQKYLDTLNKVSIPSTLAFAINHPPNDTVCSIKVLIDNLKTIT